MNDNGPTLLKVENLTKSFPGVIALNNVTFNLLKGEIHALVGENGAGKSTFIKIIGGVLQPDKGTILYDGNILSHLDPRRARSIGINIIHQESELAPTLSAAENIYMGREPTKECKWYVDIERMNEDAQEWLDKVGADFSSKVLVRDLTISQRRLLEIARAISMDTGLLILDEPTTAFTDQEVQRLFQIIRGLRNLGVTILYISHRLQEIFSIADRVTVFRDGHLISTKHIKETQEDELIRLMVGRELRAVVRDRSKPIKNTNSELVSVSKLTKEGAFNDVTFSVNKGEILGLTGLLGSGAGKIGQALFGLVEQDSGTISLNGVQVNLTSPAKAMYHEIAYIPADRKLDGLFMIKSITENISLASLEQLTKATVIDLQNERTEAKKYQTLLDIRAPSINQIVMNLSGGNQQKVLFARWLMKQAKVLILEEPTAGIDVGAKQEIYDLMSGLAQKGNSIILISSDLPEVLNVCDRIIVFRDGRIVYEIPGDEATQEIILHHSTGLCNPERKEERQ
ncbi:MAG: sugar ABC transporter ATP-binding protein [Firmicutes bacterium]|nr:sugar ABC transporter ATP-binding protein [Bacillota bacterium]